jgi:DNA polymerase IV
MTRRILHPDVDAMFVACARIADPKSAGRARLLLVGGRPEGRGVVTSASYEARAYGIRSGMPMAEAIRRCPKATVVPVPRGLVSQKSREVRAVLVDWAPVIETMSVDEHAMDLTGTEGIYREPLEETARRIRADVERRTGLVVSIGGGTNKLVAKMAVDLAKPRPGAPASGVYIVAPDGEAAFLATRTLADIPGVGPKLQERFRGRGVVTVKDALVYDAKTLTALAGASTGAWLYDVLRGNDSRAVEQRDVQKSVSREETFPVDLHGDAELERELVRLTTRVAADLRAERLRARTVTVKLRDADFRTRQASRTLEDGIESDRAVLAVAKPLLHKLRGARRTGARLLGIRLTELASPLGGDQLALFEQRASEAIESERDRTLAHTVDQIQAKHGRRGIVPGSLLEKSDG